MSIGLKTPFWKFLQPIRGLHLVSIHIKAKCLYFPTIPSGDGVDKGGGDGIGEFCTAGGEGDD